MVTRANTTLPVLLTITVLNTPLRGQSILSRDTNSTRLERMEYVVGATAAYSLFDYIGYDLVRKNPTATSIYRVVQGLTQAAISYLLYEKLGLSTAISFNLIWWTWGDDIAYYGWTELFNPAGPVWENRSNSGLLSRQIYWAWWTPIGLLRPHESLIARDALITQAVVGLSVSTALLW